MNRDCGVETADEVSQAIRLIYRSGEKPDTGH